MDVYAQVAGVVAFAPYATGVPCRLVAQREITPQPFPFDTRSAWITYDSIALVVPGFLAIGDVITGVYGNADVLVVATQPGVAWYQLGYELVQPDGEPSYFRISVGPRWY